MVDGGGLINYDESGIFNFPAHSAGSPVRLITAIRASSVSGGAGSRGAYSLQPPPPPDSGALMHCQAGMVSIGPLLDN